MNHDVEQLFNVLMQSTDAVGRGVGSVSKALRELDSKVAACVQLGDCIAIWQINKKGDELLQLFYPESADVFDFGGDVATDPLWSPIEFTEEEKRTLVILELLLGVKVVDSNPNRQKGAQELRDACVSPVPRPQFPFSDRVPFWYEPPNATSEPD